jgi:hypothetical protein
MLPMELRNGNPQIIQSKVWGCRQFHLAKTSFLLVDGWVSGPGNSVVVVLPFTLNYVSILLSSKVLIGELMSFLFFVLDMWTHSISRVHLEQFHRITNRLLHR